MPTGPIIYIKNPTSGSHFRTLLKGAGKSASAGASGSSFVKWVFAPPASAHTSHGTTGSDRTHINSVGFFPVPIPGISGSISIKTPRPPTWFTSKDYSNESWVLIQPGKYGAASLESWKSSIKRMKLPTGVKWAGTLFEGGDSPRTMQAGEAYYTAARTQGIDAPAFDNRGEGITGAANGSKGLSGVWNDAMEELGLK